MSPPAAFAIPAMSFANSDFPLASLSGNPVFLNSSSCDSNTPMRGAVGRPSRKSRYDFANVLRRSHPKGHYSIAFHGGSTEAVRDAAPVQ